MTHARLAVFALAFCCALAACSSEEKKPAPAAKKGDFLRLEIEGGGPKRTIAASTEGTIVETIDGAPRRGPLTPDELKGLQDTAAKVEWAKLPTDYKTADGKAVEGGRSYKLTALLQSPPRTVAIMDRAVGEDPNVASLRDTLEALANKIGKK